MTTKKVPEGYNTVTPYLVIDNAAYVIDFLVKSFDAREVHERIMRDGKIGHSEVKIGNSIIMIADSCEESKPMPTTFYIYTEDCDALYKRAITNGAKSLQEPVDQFYGDRSGGVEDKSGNRWYVATRKEDLSDEELKKRAEQRHKEKASAKS